MRVPLRVTTTLFCALLVRLAAAADAPTAESLYERFRQARLELSAHGPAAIIGTYSRKWMDETVAGALSASNQPPGAVDWPATRLHSRLAFLGRTSAVFSYRLAETAGDEYGLELHALAQRCEADTERPSTETLYFRLEDGLWRISRVNHNLTAKAAAWYHPGEVPLERFPLYRGLDETLIKRDAYETASAMFGYRRGDIPDDPCFPAQH